MTQYASSSLPRHDYNLSWVDNNALYTVVEKAFSRILGITGGNKNTLPPDPFLVVAQALITNTTFEDGLAFEEIRKTNKSLSNALGNMHQSILGIAPNWESLGSAGGVLDVRTKPGFIHPKLGKPIVAEVKNRFNTIKSSDEKDVWDEIDRAARLSNAQGYIFQIIPEEPQRYDKLWEPSGRKAKSTVRCCDGATAYELVFGYENALHELYLALPEIIADVKRSNSLPHDAQIPRAAEMNQLYCSVVPL